MSVKLIIINGSPAAGKSTLARKLHEDIPMSLLADVDSWRKLIAGWRDKREESLKVAYVFLVAAVDAYLGTGNSVIVDKAILSDNSVIDALIESGQKHGAEIFVFILTAERQIIIDRAEKRGFHENGLLTAQSVVELWETSRKLAADRPEAMLVDTSYLDAETVYRKVKDIIVKK